MRDALTKQGADVVLYESFSEDKLDASALVQKIDAERHDLVYTSTYFPEGGEIAKEAAAQGLRATCLMGLANQDGCSPRSRRPAAGTPIA